MTLATASRTLSGAFSLVATVALFVLMVQILNNPSITALNPELTDSGIDKIFFVFMMGGAGLCYAILSWHFFINKKLFGAPLAFVISGGFLFCLGIYYHVILCSPL